MTEKIKLKFALERAKTLWEKEKMLVTSIFSFYHNISKKASYTGSLKSGLCGQELSPLLPENVSYTCSGSRTTSRGYTYDLK